MITSGPIISGKSWRRLLGVPLFAAVAVLPSAWTFGSSHTPPPEGTFKVPASISSDCSHDVTTALNRWITKVPDGSTIQFPTGACYSLDTTVLVSQRTNLTIDGGGSTFKRLTPSNESQNPPPPNSNNPMWRIDRGSNVTLRNLTIVGNYQPTPHGTPGNGQYTDHGISIQGAQGATVENATVRDVDGDTVAIDPDVYDACRLYGCDYSKAPPSQNITVDHLAGSGAARQCASATDVDGLTFENSTLTDCQQVGLDLEMDVPGEVMRNITVQGVIVTDAYFAPFSVPVLAYPGDEGTVENITFAGNSVPSHTETCYPALWVGSDPTTTVTGLVVEGNQWGTVGDGIRFTASSTTQATISGNTITYDNPGNTGCNNPALTPPYSVPVRAAGMPGVVVDSTNTFIGF